MVVSLEEAEPHFIIIGGPNMTRYIEYLRFLILSHIKSFKVWSETYQFMKELQMYHIRYKKKSSINMKRLYKLYGVNRFKTLKEISTENRKFEEDNKELFPKLFNSPREK